MLGIGHDPVETWLILNQSWSYTVAILSSG